MQGCNPVREDQLTEEELEGLEGVNIGDDVTIKGEVHRVTCVDPLTLHPHWDL